MFNNSRCRHSPVPMLSKTENKQKFTYLCEEIFTPDYETTEIAYLSGLLAQDFSFHCPSIQNLYHKFKPNCNQFLTLQDLD